MPFLLYADDLVIYLKGDNHADILQKLQKTSSEIEKWCVAHNVTINNDKTFWQVFHKPGQKGVEGVKFVLTVFNNVIERVKVFKYLGIELDSTLTFKDQYNKVSKKVASGIGYMYSIKRLLTDNVMKVLLCSYVLSYIEYCTDIWLVQSDFCVLKLQKKIDHYLVSYYYPGLRNKKGNVDVIKLWDKLTMLSKRNMNCYYCLVPTI